jgi:hypothetical protein
MLQSTRVTRTGLERGLAELETLGLIRPSNVLLAEYLRALTAEDVLDVAAADQISAAYNRLRYSAVPDDDQPVCEAIDALERVAARAAAMTAQSRHQLAQRLSKRLDSAPAEPCLESDTDLLDGHETPVPPTRSNRTTHPNYSLRHDLELADALAKATSERSGSPSRSPATRDPWAWRALPAIHRRSNLPRVSLAFSALAALTTFLGGYCLREADNRMAAADGEISPSSSGSDRGSVKSLLRFPKRGKDVVRPEGDEEALVGPYNKTRLSLEMVLAYAPDNPVALNDLAQLYLTPDAAGTTSPRRALALAERALNISREPFILDTVAEAQFRCGNSLEAIRLQRESCTAGLASTKRLDYEFRQYRDKQLQKFQRLAQISTAERGPSRPNDAATRGNGSARSRIEPPPASGPSKSAGS